MQKETRKVETLVKESFETARKFHFGKVIEDASLASYIAQEVSCASKKTSFNLNDVFVCGVEAHSLLKNFPMVVLGMKESLRKITEKFDTKDQKEKEINTDYLYSTIYTAAMNIWSKVNKSSRYKSVALEMAIEGFGFILQQNPYKPVEGCSTKRYVPAINRSSIYHYAAVNLLHIAADPTLDSKIAINALEFILQNTPKENPYHKVVEEILVFRGIKKGQKQEPQLPARMMPIKQSHIIRRYGHCAVLRQQKLSK